ncbi:MAG: 2-oxoglutarate dehydrogenase E1 component [Bacteroidia bacterium]
MDKYSFLGAAHSSAIEKIYKEFRQDPLSVEESWRTFFEGFEFGRKNYTETPQIPEHVRKEFKVLNLINAYRVRGHLFTKTNPVRDRRKYSPTLDIENFGLTKEDLETTFQAGTEIGIGATSLLEIIDHLEETYCQSIGAEYMYIRNPEVVRWLQERMESTKNTPVLSSEQKRRILYKLNQAVVFENFLHTKFVGQKRFSLEGAETLIPALDAIIENGTERGIEEFVIGMAHRGRLNVLTNILKKTYEDVFSEFHGYEYEDLEFDGDVKYHLGFSTDITTSSGKKVHIGVTPNPSHLEAVAPVVQGIVRGKLDNRYSGDFNKISAIIIHGDAAIAAQGVVYEVIQMSQLRGYCTGGSIHMVINNQIGFTTNYIDGRSSTYCTDVAKVTLSPVFHVNGDDVEALVYTIKLAMEFRQKFHKDVFIDLLCYRKYGHNEGDEPRFTQPLLYKTIAKHPNPREIYYQKLLSQGAMDAKLANEMESEFKEMLQERLAEAKQKEKAKSTLFLGRSWKDIRYATPEDFKTNPDTSVKKELLLKISENLVSLPEDKKFFNKTKRLFNDRKEMLKGSGRLDWAMGELLAYGTLLYEGFPVRLSGQDTERGTFSHRQSVIRIEDSEEQYIPLNNLDSKQAPFYVYNSLLSEYGVLGFDYGYAWSAPNSLTLWEAQFGDFINGAQILIDQYLTGAEDKWRRMNGIVLLLPHGYEGQGAEHSSGRMERFLSSSAQNNIQVVNCTTPANFFHVLRRQLHRPFRKPLIVFTPKSLLRHPKCVSTFDEFTKGKFQNVMDDINADAKKITRLAFCIGKIYYDLDEYREKEKIDDTAIIRFEQIYPFPQDDIDSILEKYTNVKEYYWIQEEPENMGAWAFILRKFTNVKLNLISRKESASTATGSPKVHEKQQQRLVKKLFEKELVS